MARTALFLVSAIVLSCLAPPASANWVPGQLLNRITADPDSSRFLSKTTPPLKPPPGQYSLPPLPYAYDALEPYILRETNEQHRDVDVARYVTVLNEVVNDNPELKGKSLAQLVSQVGTGKLPKNAEVPVRNFAGGIWNHALYWNGLAPPSSGNTSLTKISPALSDAIKADFGSLTAFLDTFRAEAKKAFGSGFAWLVTSGRGRLSLVSTLDQDNPLMPVVTKQVVLRESDTFVAPSTATPILAVDLWEHAFLLTYGANKFGYVDDVSTLVNWAQVSANYDAALNNNLDAIVPPFGA